MLYLPYEIDIVNRADIIGSLKTWKTTQRLKSALAFRSERRD